MGIFQEIQTKYNQLIRESEDRVIREMIESSGSSWDPIQMNATEVTLEDIEKVMKEHEEKARRITKSTQPVEESRASTHTLKH